MTEIYVAITDFFITFVCLGFTWMIWQYRHGNSPFVGIWILFFLSIAFSSFFGGVVHGFLTNEASFYYQCLWIFTLLSIGVTAASCWILGGYYLFKIDRLFIWILFVILLYLPYSVIVIFFTQNYAVAMYNYLPALVFLLIANLIVLKKDKKVFCLWIIAGIWISFVAAYIQQSQISFSVNIHYNSVYHLIQVIALFMIFKGVTLQLPPQRT
ncbi:DUF6962 family protein [Legionella sainthelensi]|uniref:DUF6962 family protein n=1 Tax=Legionella sainthelensi TaxID=28087 RepID=UPI000E206208|nr:hypothetical protein [Legionella sainthelensi]